MNYLITLVLVMIASTISPMDVSLSKQRAATRIELKTSLKAVGTFYQKYPYPEILSSEKKLEIRDKIYESILQAYHTEARILGSVGIY